MLFVFGRNFRNKLIQILIQNRKAYTQRGPYSYVVVIDRSRTNHFSFLLQCSFPHITNNVFLLHRICKQFHWQLLLLAKQIWYQFLLKVLQKLEAYILERRLICCSNVWKEYITAIVLNILGEMPKNKIKWSKYFCQFGN